MERNQKEKMAYISVPFAIRPDLYEGQKCIEVSTRINSSCGTKFDAFGCTYLYFNYDEDGKMNILGFEYEPRYTERGENNAQNYLGFVYELEDVE